MSSVAEAAVTCLVCDTKNRSADGAVLSCSQCDAMLFKPGPGPTVLIVHESDAMSEEIGGVLSSEGFTPVRTAEGEATASWVERADAAGVVVDVGLTDPGAFLVVDELRNRSSRSDVKIVLVASVFNKTAYKRRPSSLYGADDYVEQHHIPDLLPAKLGRLLDFDVSAAMTPQMRETVKRIEEAHRRTELNGPARVRALAGAIVADAAMYNEERVKEAQARGSVTELDDLLVESRRILAELAHGEHYPGHDPVLEAFEKMVKNQEGQS